jgi:tetratricopeptide (TPR) repeat protein
MADSYSALIDAIVNATLKGEIQSESQVRDYLERDIEVGSEAEFAQVLGDRVTTTKAQADDNSDELKQAKAIRSLRALKLLQNEWSRYQSDRAAQGAIITATQTILSATSEQKLWTWIRATDLNQVPGLSTDELKQLGRSLTQFSTAGATNSEIDSAQVLEQLARGTTKGLEASRILEGHLFEWMYATQGMRGFEADIPETRGPWKLWSEKSQSTVLKQLFQTLATAQSVADWSKQYPFDTTDFVEVAIAFRTVQKRLIHWFEQQPYDSKVGTQAAISTFLTFAVVWSQLAQGMAEAGRSILQQGCFQLVLQILRGFATRPYFPFYGGVLALLSGEQLQGALTYLDEPLRQVENTQAKARILTLLGYSYRSVGQYERALEFHQQALELAQAGEEPDQPCAIANLNHLSRIHFALKDYSEGLRCSQQALVISRSTGDSLGRAHALTNVGYGEVLAARSTEQMEPEVYEMPIDWLQQGLRLSESLGDRQCQSLCNNSLGIAYVTLGQFQTAIPFLLKGEELARESGDFYLQGLNCTYLAEVFYGLEDYTKAACVAAYGMYFLDQVRSREWRQAAGLLRVLQGKMGQTELWEAIASRRSQMIAVIGVDGYDYLPKLLEQYNSDS